jgi:hypothetical protein
LSVLRILTKILWWTVDSLAISSFSTFNNSLYFNLSLASLTSLSISSSPAFYSSDVFPNLGLPSATSFSCFFFKTSAFSSSVWSEEAWMLLIWTPSDSIPNTLCYSKKKLVALAKFSFLISSLV